MGLIATLATVFYWIAVRVVKLWVHWFPNAHPTVQLRLDPDPQAPAGCWWVHGASLGEVGGAMRVARRLRWESGAPVLVTSTTQSGLDRAKREVDHDPDGGLYARMLPFDHPSVLEPFLDKLKPRALLLFEGDLWPHLLPACRKRSIQVVLVSARMQRKSRFLLALSGGWPAWWLNAAICREAEDVRVLQKRIVGPVVEGGDWKVLPDSMLPPEPLPPDHLVRDFALGVISMHKEEWKKVRKFIRLLLDQGEAVVLVPRFPEESQWFRERMRKEGIQSMAWPKSNGGHVTLVDLYGIVPSALARSRCALVGGGFGAHGLHDVLEPLRHGVPVLAGPKGGVLEPLCARLERQGALLRPWGRGGVKALAALPRRIPDASDPEMRENVSRALATEIARAAEGWRELRAILPFQARPSNRLPT